MQRAATLVGSFARVVEAATPEEMEWGLPVNSSSPGKAATITFLGFVVAGLIPLLPLLLAGTIGARTTFLVSAIGAAVTFRASSDGGEGGRRWRPMD